LVAAQKRRFELPFGAARIDDNRVSIPEDNW
jgi:hypothetical protein